MKAAPGKGRLPPWPEEPKEELDSWSYKTGLKDEVKAEISSLPSLSGIEKRACILLQAAGECKIPIFHEQVAKKLGFLDIDKLIEYRPPLQELGIWSSPTIPQCM